MIFKPAKFEYLLPENLYDEILPYPVIHGKVYKKTKPKDGYFKLIPLKK